MLKCIVWDLDDTIWSGEIKNSPDVTLNNEVVEIIKSADSSGIMQSVASRNDRQEALHLLAKFGIEHFFIFPQIDLYRPKVSGIRKIAAHFNISLDSVAFVDDNPFERYEVNRYLPEVFTYGMEELGALRGLLEDTAGVSPVTANRRELMLIREKRLLAEQAFNGSREDFLRECSMHLTIRKACSDDLARISELTFRTNRLNNLREPMDMPMLERYAADADKFLYVCELDDIFGTHGIVGACLLHMCSNELRLDLFCISCRIEGRGIGTAFLSGVLGDILLNHGNIRHIMCRYRKYEKDKSALMLLKLTGFHVVQEQADEITMQLDVPFTKISPEWLAIELVLREDR